MPGLFLDRDPNRRMGGAVTGSAQNQQQAYRNSGMYGVGARTHSSAAQQYDQYGQPIQTPGVYQGGTSNRRAGMPENGMVGAPNLGTWASLMQFQSQGGTLPPGLQPSYSGPGGSGWGQGWGASGAAGPGFGTQAFPVGNQPQGQPAFFSPTNRGPGGQSSGFMPAPWNGGGGQSQQFSSNPQLPGQGGGTNDRLGNTLESRINSLLRNPGYEQQLRGQTSAAVAGGQQMAENRTREDAIRRGASTRAGGDADIRDSLNRVGQQGALDQARAGLDVDRQLDDRLFSALGAGTQLRGQNLQERQSIRQLQQILAMLQAEQGQNNLGFALSL